MKFRTLMVALAFSATVSAVITAATLGESQESSLAETCGFATWPTIPSHCLGGATKAGVRVIAIDSEAMRAMKSRFSAAFGPGPGD